MTLRAASDPLSRSPAFSPYCAAVGFADGLTSDNVVGYNTFTCQPNTWYLFGAQFEKTNGNSMNIQEFLSGNYVATSDTLTAPEIQLWSGNNYVHYYFLELAYDDDLNEYQNVWTDAGGTYTELAINPGEGLWFKHKASSAIDVTVSGQVLETASETTTIPANQWKCLSNPYPVAFALNGTKVDWLSILTATSDTLTAPEIQLWSGSNYVHYYFLSLAYDDDLNEYENVWTDAGGTYTSYSIPVGTGFWIKNKVGSPVNLVISK